MAESNITLVEALKGLEFISPIKIVFNAVLLYDDWDFDETKPPLESIRERLWLYDKYVITSMNIEIKDFHHSFVYLKGELREK